MLKMVISSIKYLDKGWLVAEHPLGHLGDTGIPSMPCRHWGWLGRVKLRSAVSLSQQEVGTTCRMASPTLPNRRGQGPCASSPLSCPSFQDFGRRGGTAFCLSRDLIFSLSTSHKPSESEGMAFLLSILLNTLLHHKLHFPLVILNLFLSLEL